MFMYIRKCVYLCIYYVFYAVFVCVSDMGKAHIRKGINKSQIFFLTNLNHFVESQILYLSQLNKSQIVNAQIFK